MTNRELTRLEAKLKDTDAELFGHYAVVVRKARDLMPRAYATFWEYTDHSLTHSHAVIEQIDNLCTASQIASFTASELFILLSGATLHDIGMVTSEPMRGEDATSLRKCHDVAGAEKILSNPELYGVPRQYASCVSRVVRHHRSSSIAAEVKDEPVGSSMVRLRLLCALVRAGDELHITEDRAPEVVVENLNLSEESVRHFANCKAVSGVARDTENENLVLVSATVTDSLGQAGVSEVVGKVNAELGALESIFTEHGLPNYRAELRLNRHVLVTRKVLLYICEQVEGVTVQRIAEALGEDPKEVNDAIRSHLLKRLIREGSQGNVAFAAISDDLEVFREIAGQFLKSPDDLTFLKTAYAVDTIEKVVVPWLCREFGCGYTAGEIMTRIEVLRHSPSALELAMSSADVGVVPSVLSRRVLLDQLLLSGMMRDIYLRPEIGEGVDIGKAVAQLGRHIARRVGPFARVVSRAWTYRDISIEEMRQRVVPTGKSVLPEEAFPVRMSMEIQFPQEPAFLSLPHLEFAAREESTFLEIASPQLKSFMVNVGSQSTTFDSSTGGQSLRMMFNFQAPRPALPSPEMPCRFEVDEERQVCTLYVDETREFDQQSFPMRMVVTDLTRYPKCSLKPTSNCGPMSSGALLQQLKLDRILATHHRCKIEVVDSKSGHVESTAELTCTEGEEVESNEEHLKAIEMLAWLEKLIGLTIDPPTFPSETQLRKLIELQGELTSADEETMLRLLRDVGSSESTEWTRFRVTVIDDSGQIVCDSYPDIHLGLPELHLQLADGSKDQQATEKTRQGGPSAHYWSTRSPREIVEMFTSGISKHDYWAPDFQGDPKGIIQSEVHYEISALKRGMWGWEQLIHLTVKPQPAHRRLLDMAGAAIDKGDFESAEEYLTELVVAEPTLGLAHHNLGVVLYELTQLDKAERTFKNVLALGGEGWPYKATAHATIGLINLHRGQLDVALKCYEAALRDVSFNVVEAVEMIEKKLPSNINVSAARYAAGWLLMRGELCARAREHLRQFLALDDPAHKHFRESAIELMSDCE